MTQALREQRGPGAGEMVAIKALQKYSKPPNCCDAL
jgi:hypothetical protein